MFKHKPFLSLSLLFKLLITALAYTYIYYRINDSLSQNQVFKLILPWTLKKTGLILVTIILMIFNWLIESFKWQKLLTPIEKTSLDISTRSVLVGITCSIFTPYRIGEYLGRPMLLKKQNRTKAVMANFLGSLSQNIITFGLGIIGTSLLVLNHTQNLLSSDNKMLIQILLFCFCFILLFFYFSPVYLIKVIKSIRPLKKLTTKLEFLKNYKKVELLIILLLSLSRYLIFSFQYYLLLVFFDIDIRLIDAFTAISLSYVFLFSIPGIPIADIGIRGSLALFFLGMFSSNDIAIISASSALWIINLAIPSIIGSYYLIKNKMTEG